MSTPYTETTNTKMWQEVGWELLPYNVSVLAVSPPDIFLDFNPVEDQGLPTTSDIELVQSSEGYSIDQYTHETLVQKSLQEFGEIWRILADM